MVKALRKSVMGLALGAALMMGWGTASQAAGSELKIAFPVDIPSWDPTSVTFPAGQSIYKAVFDSPLFVGDDLKVAPRLIESWEWADEQGQALKVKLRDKVKFHDGSDMTAEDLKFTFDRAINKKTLALNGMLPTLKSVEVTGPLEAIIHFSSPTPTAPKGLAFLSAYILPKAYFEKVGEEEFLKRPIGAGPYKLSDYQRGSRITLEAFEDYWQGAPDLKQVVFEIVPDSSARVAAVESGRADVSVQIPVREITRLEKNPKLEAKVYPYSEIYILQMPSYVESFKDVHVRRAMNMAIDKAGLSRAFYKNVAQPLSVLATKGSPGDVPDLNIPFDKKAAVEELAKAGYSTEKPLTITLYSTNNTFPSDYDVARAVAQMWSQIGVQTTVEEITVAKYLELSHSSKLTGVMLYSWANATGDPEIFTGRILDPRLRFSTWKEERLAGTLDELNRQMDEDKRVAGYQALNREAAEQAWSLPVLQSTSTIAYKKGLKLNTYQTGYILPQEYSWQ